MTLTNENLKIAETVCRQISDTAKSMMMLAVMAKDGSVSSIVLTPEQKQGLIDSYLQGKSRLVELYDQLP